MYMGLQRCVNSFFTRKLSNSTKTLQVVKHLIIEVFIVANENGSGQVRVYEKTTFAFYSYLTTK